jgi:hypothetical protein
MRAGRGKQWDSL